MDFTKTEKGYIVRLDRGEEITGKLKEFCSLQGIDCGTVIGIGSVESLKLGHYRVDTKRYTTREFNEPMEVSNLTGNICRMNGETYLHLHITVGNEQMQAYTGHLASGTVGGTCEVFISDDKGDVERRFSEETGLNLYSFSR